MGNFEEYKLANTPYVFMPQNQWLTSEKKTCANLRRDEYKMWSRKFENVKTLFPDISVVAVGEFSPQDDGI